MQIKNSIKFIIFFLLCFFVSYINLNAEEFNISAKEIVIDKDNEILTGTGMVEVIDSDGRIINANKIVYKKTIKFLTAEGDVIINDVDGNILKTNKATFDKLNNFSLAIFQILCKICWKVH